MSGESTPSQDVSQKSLGGAMATILQMKVKGQQPSNGCNICQSDDDLFLSIIIEEWILIQELQKHTDGRRHRNIDALLQSLAEKHVLLYDNSTINGQTGDIFHLNRALTNLWRVVNIPPSTISARLESETQSSKDTQLEELMSNQEEITNYHLHAIMQTQLVNRKLWEATGEIKYLEAAIASAECFLRVPVSSGDVACVAPDQDNVNAATTIPPVETKTDEAESEIDTDGRHWVLRTALIWLVDFLDQPGSGESKGFTTRCIVAAHILALTETYRDISELGSVIFPRIPSKALLGLSKSLNTFYRANPNDSDAERVLAIGLAMCHLGKEQAKDDQNLESLLAANLSAFHGLLMKREGQSSKDAEGEHEIDPPASPSWNSKGSSSLSWDTFHEAMNKFSEYRHFSGKSEETDDPVKPPGMDENTWNKQKLQLEAERRTKRKEDLLKRQTLLKDAIAMCRRAIEYAMECLRREKDEEKPALGDWARTLGNMAKEKIQSLVEQGRSDIGGFLEVKKLLEEGLGLISEEDIYQKCPEARPYLLVSLAEVCESIYRQDPDNNTEYFAEGIRRAKEVLDIMRIGVPSTYAFIVAENSARNVLSRLHLVAFERSGKVDDLQRALAQTTKALESQNPQQLFSPYGDGDIKFRTLAELFGYLADLSTLAQILARRFSSTGNYPDILVAIKYQQVVVKFCAPDKLLRTNYRVQLSQYLGMQYESRRLTSDIDKENVLEEAVYQARIAWKVLRKTGDAHVRADCLLALSNAYESRYRLDPEKFSEDYVLAKNGLEIYVDRFRSELTNLDLTRLSTQLSRLLARSECPEDLRKASKYAADALLYCPAKLTLLRADLNYQYAKQFLANPHVKGTPGAGMIVLPDLEACSTCHNATPITRLLAVVQSCKLLKEAGEWDELFKIASGAMEIFRLLPIQSLSSQDQQKVLKEYVGFAPMAAAAALEVGEQAAAAVLQAGKQAAGATLKVGNPAAEALRILEEGRDIIAGQRFNARVDLSALQQASPLLADRFVECQEELDPSGIKGKKQSASGSNDFGGKLLQACYDLQGVIRDIRRLEGFERFLMPPGVEEMKNAAGDGAIVVISVAEWRCDAFIVRQDPQFDIISIPLPNLSQEEINKHISEVAVVGPGLLHYLWTAVAEPVLSTLKYNHDLPDEWPLEKYPRVWWCTTGIASRLPIHAATKGTLTPFGRHSCVMNRVVSSYTSSIKALIFSRGQAAIRKSLRPEERGRTAVLCSVEKTQIRLQDVDPRKTTGHFPSLSGPPIEVGILSKIITKAIKRIPEQCALEPVPLFDPPKEKIIFRLAPPPGAPPQDYPAIFHFAGHGYSTPIDPSRSSIIPYDEALEVRELAEINIHERAPILAYLSAE